MPADQWADEFKLLKSSDTIVMGRGMYPDYASYWRGALTTPGSPPNEVKYARLAENIPHLVFSRTLKRVHWENTRIVKGDFEKEIRALKRRRGKHLLALGGAKFAASLIEHGLVDELQLIVNPALLGRGKSLFKGVTRWRDLRLDGSKKFRSGAILLRYANLGLHR